MNMENEFAETSNLSEVHITDDQTEENEQLDLTKFSKEELLNFLLNIKLEESTGKANSLIRNIRTQYDSIYESEKAEALQSFIGADGVADDFEYKKTELDQKFEKAFDQFREKISLQHATLEKEKDKNLKEKNNLLDKLRSLISAEETTTSINVLKDIQTEWKKIGQVPASHNQELWANYNALIERFYNNRSIYFELKELDRKKNLESKIELCEKAEKLAGMESVTQAIKDLKALHDEYKHLGPVPKDDQEILWARFKAASDKVYEKRNEYFDQLKKEQEENFITIDVDKKKPDIIKKGEFIDSEILLSSSMQLDLFKNNNQLGTILLFNAQGLIGIGYVENIIK